MLGRCGIVCAQLCLCREDWPVLQHYCIIVFALLDSCAIFFVVHLFVLFCFNHLINHTTVFLVLNIFSRAINLIICINLSIKYSNKNI